MVTGDWKKRRQAIATALWVLFSASAAAQLLSQETPDNDDEVEIVHRYSVEVIVFEYSSNVAVGNEIFEAKQPPPPLEPEVPVFSDPTGIPGVAHNIDNEAIEFDDAVDMAREEDTEIEEIPALASIDFKLLEPQQMTMGDIHQRLVKLDSYQPVLWGGWTQATKEPALAPAIHLRLLGPPPIYMHGTFKLYLKNYLHLVVDLTKELQIATVQDIYRQEKPTYGGFRDKDDSTFGVTDTETVLYQINEDRIFRSGQLRYYDHPKFGVLARVNRVEAETTDEDAESDDDLAKPAMMSTKH